MLQITLMFLIRHKWFYCRFFLTNKIDLIFHSWVLKVIWYNMFQNIWWQIFHLLKWNSNSNCFSSTHDAICPFTLFSFSMTRFNAFFASSASTISSNVTQAYFQAAFLHSHVLNVLQLAFCHRSLGPLTQIFSELKCWILVGRKFFIHESISCLRWRVTMMDRSFNGPCHEIKPTDSLFFHRGFVFNSNIWQHCLSGDRALKNKN